VSSLHTCFSSSKQLLSVGLFKNSLFSKQKTKKQNKTKQNKTKQKNTTKQKNKMEIASSETQPFFSAWKLFQAGVSHTFVLDRDAK